MRTLSSKRAMSPSAVLLERRVGDYTLSIVRYTPWQELSTHAHDQDGISVILQGQAVEEAEHRCTVAQAGWTAARPYGVRHSNRFGPRGAVVLAIVPDRQTFGGLLRRWRWSDSPIAYRAGLRLFAHGGEALTELLAELTPDEGRRGDVQLAMRARRILDDPAGTISVAQLARDLDLHPVSLTRRFRQAFGVSIREYRAIQMVRRANEAVLSTQHSLSRVAHECGFADHSHMCRAFRSVAGWKPSRMRVAVQQGVAVKRSR